MKSSTKTSPTASGALQVGVLIVSYKSAALAIDCLHSIENERAGLPPWIQAKVIIVDNASGDAPPIAEAIQANSWSSWAGVITAPRNGGFAYGNNLAYQHMRQDVLPDYVYLLNPDTIVRPGAIAALVQFLQSHPNVGIAGSSFEHPDGTPWPFAFRFPSILGELELGLQLGVARRFLRRSAIRVDMGSSLQAIDWVSGASMMVRRSVFDALNGLDENFFIYFEELDFCLRARKMGFETWYVPASRVMHILGQSTKVTEVNAPVKRLPEYWFESRRWYFVANHGFAYSVAVDAAAVLAFGLGFLRLAVQRRRDRQVPHFLRDLIRHSALWSGIRKADRQRKRLGLTAHMA
jgi:GT2 family glycosyltransferase